MTRPIAVRFQDAIGDQAKRLRTRALLMDCAIAEFAGRGIERTSVDDIVSRAKVSHGTFYYHFANKDEIADAVGRAVAAGLVTIVDRDIRDISAGAERVAMATQTFIRLASTIPQWGWLVVHAFADMGTFYDQISRGIRKDVLIGVRSGEFRAEPTELLFESLLAVVGTAVRARLTKPAEKNIETEATTLLLRMLGVAPRTALTLPRKVVEKYGDKSMSASRSVQADVQMLMPLLLQEVMAHETERAGR